MRDLLMSRTYIGSIGGDSRPDEDFPKFLEWFRQGKLDLNRLVTARFSLEQINDACASLSSGEISGRGIITFD